MTVTSVKVHAVDVPGRMKALATITLDDTFVVHDLRVIEGEKGLFVAMPSKRGFDGRFRDVAHPVTQELRDMIEAAVLRAYLQAVAARTHVC
ncbi:MAG: putative septation protein SpoVG [Firmicutes bacterium ADurb.Bin506]|nr:MAG: putative septation protein SpoVG [Firmicutes bacterium ADurb.Bin506]